MVDSLKIPQADDVIKIIDIPLGVANGASSLADAAQRYSFDRRQALYYFEAAQMLGLIVRTKSKYSLSPLGRQYLALGYSERKRLIIRKMLSLEVCMRILSELVTSPKHAMSHRDIEELVATHAGLSETTLRRRVHTLLNWFAWIGQENRAFKVDGETLYINLRAE
jgi:hypothetical protein